MNSLLRTPLETLQEAKGFITELDQITQSLITAIEQETAHVRQGKLKTAIAIAEQKEKLSTTYQALMEKFKANRELLTQNFPKECETLKKTHEKFGQALQTNMIVLATAQSVSENILRNVATDLGKEKEPKTYSAYGQMQSPKRPLTSPLLVSKSS